MTTTTNVQDEQRIEAVRASIVVGSSFSWSYLFMNVVAATIACYGLFANSPAVVIGAMIVAMLLGPITGVALALVESDMILLKNGLSTLMGGVLGVLITALILGTIHRSIPITNEIMARTSPNLLDLMIALAGGAAGAYATASPRLSIAFVGVAIATALVPPLSSASILLARGEIHLATGAFLLAVTNMVAIQFASSVVLWFSGFRRVTRTTGLGFLAFLERNIISIIVLLALGSTLAGNLNRVISQQLFQSTTRGTLHQQIDDLAGNYLADVRFETTSGTTIVRAVVRGPNAPSAAQVAAIEAKLPSPPDGTKIELRIRFVQTAIINREGALFADAGFGNSD